MYDAFLRLQDSIVPNPGSETERYNLFAEIGLAKAREVTAMAKRILSQYSDLDVMSMGTNLLGMINRAKRRANEFDPQTKRFSLVKASEKTKADMMETSSGDFVPAKKYDDALSYIKDLETNASFQEENVLALRISLRLLLQGIGTLRDAADEQSKAEAIENLIARAEDLGETTNRQLLEEE